MLSFRTVKILFYWKIVSLLRLLVYHSFFSEVLNAKDEQAIWICTIKFAMNGFLVKICLKPHRKQRKIGFWTIVISTYQIRSTTFCWNLPSWSGLQSKLLKISKKNCGIQQINTDYKQKFSWKLQQCIFFLNLTEKKLRFTHHLFFA